MIIFTHQSSFYYERMTISLKSPWIRSLQGGKARNHLPGRSGFSGRGREAIGENKTIFFSLFVRAVMRDPEASIIPLYHSYDPCLLDPFYGFH